MQVQGRALLSVFHHPPAHGHGDTTYEISLPALKPKERPLLRFAISFGRLRRVRHPHSWP